MQTEIGGRQEFAKHKMRLLFAAVASTLFFVVLAKNLTIEEYKTLPNNGSKIYTKASYIECSSDSKCKYAPNTFFFSLN